MGKTSGTGAGSARRAREKLTAAELRAAELGFRQLLRRKRFSAAFIERHCAELLAQARYEYARHLAAGGKAQSPAGWLIHCAWRRTQNLLEQESRAPGTVSVEGRGAFAGNGGTPEEKVLGADRRRQVQEAVQELPGEERKLIALTYFEGLSVREASRLLSWDKCKGDRRHHAALERLRDLLGVEDLDSLQIEIGLAAWVSVAAGRRAGLLGSLQGGAEALSRLSVELLPRAQELARRLLGGGAAEPGVGVAAGGAGRAVGGACGAAVAICLGAGVVGPGVGGVDVVGEPSPQPRPGRAAAASAAQATSNLATPQSPASARSAPESAAGGSKTGRREKRRQRARSSGASGHGPSPAASAQATSGQTIERSFGLYAEGGDTAEAPDSAPSSSSTGSGESSSPSPSSSPPPEASGEQVEAEFGL